jgi:hypothetical protein
MYITNSLKVPGLILIFRDIKTTLSIYYIYITIGSIKRIFFYEIKSLDMSSVKCWNSFLYNINTSKLKGNISANFKTIVSWDVILCIPVDYQCFLFPVPSIFWVEDGGRK